MTKRSLGLQLNIVFSIVVVVTSVFFVITIRRTFYNITLEQDRYQQREFFEQIYDMYLKDTLHKDPIPTNEYNGHIVIMKKGNVVDRILFDGNGMLTESEAIQKAEVMFGSIYNYAYQEINDGLHYIGGSINQGSVIILTFTDGRHQAISNANISNRVLWGFTAIMILGNVFIMLWSNLLVERIKILKTDVLQLTKKHYNHKIKIDGDDEVSDLAKSIENMRIEILKKETEKKEMLKMLVTTLKHRLPLFVHYAEAVRDGISDPIDLNVVIKQTEILSNKVKQLLELNKLEYLKKQETFVDVNIKNLITQIVNLHKFQNIKFELDLDEGSYYGTSENLYIAFSNIIDNALRYAKSVIRITFKNKKLTIFNDGEPVDPNYLDNAFKPYQKGPKGESGLGLHIVYKTLSHFNLSVQIVNEKEGVSFIIEPSL